ncbi:DNA polymerase III subunit beta [Pararhodospirillum oryzae]|uniref:Beta sliding clamp n=1 Tax=Pararhodospirillum oryzae TaxID=478448 RepID=A0A512H493_9PROT|nr:DNA polymerase III subunit beta [Pararhodospirillum oryzae]GEO80284.1 DNA polymerase III subunit beta [Pararhodospirillum oryzae]
MKLTIERTAFLKSLGHVQSVVERRNTIPILSNLRMDATDQGLALNATDMDLEIVETLGAEVATPGLTTAPAHTLYDIVRKLPDGSQVELTHDATEGQLVLRAGRSRFRLACLPVDDFPVMNPGEFSHTFAIPSADLRSLIDRTRFAISTEETRYYLNGIFLHATENAGVPVLRAVATDGHRLACVETPLPEGAAGMPAVILPRKTVGELRKLIDETGMAVTVSLSEHKVRFAFDDVRLISKLIDGKFPDYERVIPTDNDKVLEVERQPFAQAVDRVAAISTEKSRAIKVAATPGLLTLSASSPDAGSALEEIEAKFEAAPLDIGFNARYLLDILDQIQGDSVRLTLADSSSPTVLRDGADGSAVYVLMPMRV